MKPKKPYWHMDVRQLREATAEFERESSHLPGKPLSATDKALLREAGKKRGRPPVGQGAKRVLISVEKDLLRKADAYAKTHKMSRSHLVARGLKAVLAGAG